MHPIEKKKVQCCGPLGLWGEHIPELGPLPQPRRWVRGKALVFEWSPKQEKALKEVQESSLPLGKANLAKAGQVRVSILTKGITPQAGPWGSGARPYLLQWRIIHLLKSHLHPAAWPC